MNSELDRIQKEYNRRSLRPGEKDKYSFFDSPNLFIIQAREREILNLLRKNRLQPLHQGNILEVGCGSGGVLVQFLLYGSNVKTINGTDLLLSRLMDAKTHINVLQVSCADGQYLPYLSEGFDLVIQSTVFSSILDDTIKRNIAREMIRVLKPEGMILWYDFWLNPTNKQTRGIRPPEIRNLFPGCQYDFHRITLAPPIARCVVPVSWTLALLLEKARIFNSHYLVAIRPAPQGA